VPPTSACACVARVAPTGESSSMWVTHTPVFVHIARQPPCPEQIINSIPLTLQINYYIQTLDQEEIMKELLKVIQRGQSLRGTFDPKRPVPKDDLMQVLEAGRWTPTAHNMQNFEIIVVDDKELLENIGNIKSPISEEFLRENYQQLSFSEKELLQKKVGLLGTLFPPEWRNPAKLGEVARKSVPFSLSQIINGSPTILIVIYDSRKRAPASEGDFLGIISLGCVMENM